MRSAALASALALLACSGCAVSGDKAGPPAAPTAQACPWDSVLGDTDLGLSDRNASYLWRWFEIGPGREVRIDGAFPSSRYVSFVVQDHNGAVIDSLDDVAIQPKTGRNPFRPGAPRGGAEHGRYHIRVVPEAPPAAGRAPNTLYAGRTLRGEPNELVLLSFRNYLTDLRFAKASGNPKWITGGVDAPALSFWTEAAPQPCPELGVARSAWRARQAPTSEQTRGVSAVPGATAPLNPPQWIHTERATTRARNKLGPNDSTIYISTALSAKFGDLLVFEWTPPRSPVGAYDGSPFPAESDVRYWSLSFMYKHPTATDFGGVRTERTVADTDVRRLADGSVRLVVGLGGRERPAFVPEDQWVGLTLSEGTAMVREILTSPGYAGDLGRLPRGVVPAGYLRFVPGGRYVTEAQLRTAYRQNEGGGRE